MNKSKITLIAIVVIVIFVIGAWFGGNYFASKQFEKELNRAVHEHELEDKVKWGDASATIFGSASIKDLSYTEDETVLNIEKVDINKYKDEESEFAADVELNNIKAVKVAPKFKQADFGEALPFRWNDAAHPIQKAHIKVDVDRKNNTQSLKLNVKQDEVAYSDINIKTRNLEPVIGFISAKVHNSSSADDVNRLDKKNAVDLLAKAEIDSSSIKIEDKGFVDMIQHNKGGEYKPLLADDKQCTQNLEFFGIKNSDSYCKPVWQFLSKKEKKLEVSIDPSKPYPIMAIPQLIYGGHALLINKLVDDLKFKVSN